MVVCKCRKATRLYCFVHKDPVCGECICFPEHQICVVKNYSDWVVDGEYDWPPICALCHAALEAGSGAQTTRLGCLHLMHTNCLVSHIQSFPPQTTPAEYVCPTCSSPIWPPKSIKDTGSRLHTKLKEAIIKSGLEKNIFGNLMVSLPIEESHVPPAFASDPLRSVLGVEDRGKNDQNAFSYAHNSSSSTSAGRGKYSIELQSTMGIGSSKLQEPEIIEIDVPNPTGNQFITDQEPSFMKTSSPVGPGATTRKGNYHVDRQNSDMSYYADDEDGNRNKYSRRGPFSHKLLRLLLPFWSSAMPTLPVTAPPRKEGAGDDASEGRLRHQRSARMDPRKILLTIAIMACIATVGILYYRLAQGSPGENTAKDEPQ